MLIHFSDCLSLLIIILLSRKRNRADDESDTSENEEPDDQEEEASEDDDDEESESDEESSSDDDDDDDFQAAKSSKKSKRASPGGNGARTTKKSSSAASKKTKIQIGKSSKKKTTKRNQQSSTSTSTSTKQIKTALSTLAKHVLPPTEEPGLKSLIAGLLSSYRPPKPIQLANFDSNVAFVVRSPYTVNLHSLAEKVIELHNENPNRAQLALLNLLFRSVGGGPETCFPIGGGATTSTAAATTTEDGEEGEEEVEETDLEQMETEDWATVVTDLVDDMRHAPANQILLCADPLGAVHQQNTLNRHDGGGGSDAKDTNEEEEEKKKGSKQYALGAAEFRKIYQEFWYILGYVALTEGGMATNTQQEGEEEEEEVSGNSVVRLDAELVKELIERVVELAPVGQPDVRAGAILAAISMSHAVLDQSAQLVKKMDVASRQYQAAKKGKNTSKAEALKVRIDSLKRSAEDLQQVVMVNFVQGLFVHRYR